MYGRGSAFIVNILFCKYSSQNFKFRPLCLMNVGYFMMCDISYLCIK